MNRTRGSLENGVLNILHIMGRGWRSGGGASGKPWASEN